MLHLLMKHYTSTPILNQCRKLNFFLYNIFLMKIDLALNEIFFFIQISSALQLQTTKWRRIRTKRGGYGLRDGKMRRWLVRGFKSTYWLLWHISRKLRREIVRKAKISWFRTSQKIVRKSSTKKTPLSSSLSLRTKILSEKETN